MVVHDDLQAAALGDLVALLAGLTVRAGPPAPPAAPGRAAAAAAPRNLLRLALDVAAVGPGHVDRLVAALGVRLDLELDRLAVRQGAEVLGVDHALVHEEVVSPLLGGDEAEALHGVEPLDGPDLLRHTEAPNAPVTSPP